MPGPVSQSYFGPPDFVDDWKEHLRSEGLKFFVLKAEAFLDALGEDDAAAFNEMLQKYERARMAALKPAANRYWVTNRDEPWADEVEAVMRKHVDLGTRVT